MQIKSKRVALVAAISGTCIAAAVLAPIASGAATGYTLSAGGAIKASQTSKLVFTDTTSSSKPQLTCPTFTGTGTAVKGAHKFVPKTYKSSTGLNAAGSLSKEALTGCTNPVVGKVTIKPSAKWSLGFSSKSSTGATGYLYNVTATVSAAGCTFVSKGAVYGKYANKTGVFSGTATSGLVLSSVKGGSCALVGVKNGDKASLKGNIKIAPKLTVK